MSTSIRSTVIGGAALLLGLGTAVPVVAWASTPVVVHKMATTHKRVMGNAHVKAVQKALDKSGAKLKVDGLMGKLTEGALKKFQAKHGLTVTGTADKATLKALGVK
ncbi:MAG: peptidoglycan-binding domain-containing protein [Acidiferrobacter sp.]